MRGAVSENRNLPRIGRRRVLGAAIAGSAGLLAACTRRSKYLADSAAPRTNAAHEILRPWQRNVLYWIAVTMLPDTEGWPTVEQLRIVERVEEKLSHMAKADIEDMLALLAIVEYGAPFLGGGLSTFSGMTAESRERYLGAWESSSLSIKRSGFAGLKYLVMMHYYDDPAAWPGVGYLGPPKFDLK